LVVVASAWDHLAGPASRVVFAAVLFVPRMCYRV
jgi:hypothetical protein